MRRSDRIRISNAFSRASLGTINVIFMAPGRTGSPPSKVMFVTRPLVEDFRLESRRARVENQLTLSFFDEDKVGTI